MNFNCIFPFEKYIENLFLNLYFLVLRMMPKMRTYVPPQMPEQTLSGDQLPLLMAMAEIFKLILYVMNCLF